ncbi:hypothetical protein JZO70_00955 [Enterococcus sp. 669A]|uniref:YitT family protein n=1 Tax=Candidatus Enterococcus moelleringii TaxID=2815325 RepID=A0ABS3L525_9ENTE|nr:YitT family protein [Enterococcus sp. 669A]MBO1304712.1 hypothetical protein [Enterococcus sp. 669A]
MKMFIRYLISVLGSSLVGVGVGLCVVTGLGADALGVLWEGLTQHLPVTVGQASLLVTAVCLLLVTFINKKELGLATILNPLATSIFTDLIIKQVSVQGAILLRLAVVIVGISFIGIGSGIAAATNTGKEGYIALSFALSGRLSIDLAKVRMVLDLICFVTGMLLGGKFMIGPIFGVVLIGPLLKLTSQYCGRKMLPIM